MLIPTLFRIVSIVKIRKKLTFFNDGVIILKFSIDNAPCYCLHGGGEREGSDKVH
jgi:hypothetical protein